MISIKDDGVIGAGLSVAGTTGLTLQAVMDGLSLAVLVINLTLGLGGLILLWRRLKKGGK